MLPPFLLSLPYEKATSAAAAYIKSSHSVPNLRYHAVSHSVYDGQCVCTINSPNNTNRVQLILVNHIHTRGFAITYHLTRVTCIYHK